MILITGSAGYIGSHICLYFERKKINYIGIDNLSYSYLSNIQNRKKFFKLDISNSNKLREIIVNNKISTVIHAAAFSYVVEGEFFKKKYFLNNIIKTKRFIDCCKKNNIKNFIFLSSSNVYKENKNRNGYKETDVLKPKNFYGKNKFEIEKYINNKFQNVIILRLFNVIGIFNKKFKIFKFKKKNYQRLIFKIIQNINLKKLTNINFFKIKNNIVYPSRDFIDIKDVIKIIDKIIKELYSKNISGVYNIGTGKDISIDKIINIFNNFKNKKFKFKLNNISKKEFLHTKSNISKLAKMLGERPKLNLKNVIKSHF